MGEQGVPTLEKWLSEEATDLRDSKNASEGVENKERTEDGTGSMEPKKEGEGKKGEGGFRLGVDPWLVSAGTARSLKAKLTGSGGGLVAIPG